MHCFQNKNMWITSKIFNMIGHIEVSHAHLSRANIENAYTETRE